MDMCTPDFFERQVASLADAGPWLVEPAERRVGNPLADEDAKLIANGYEPIAVNGKAAVGKGWSSRPNTIEAVTGERHAHPCAINTGLRTGRLVGVDIDVIPPDHVKAIEALAFEVLGGTGMERIGKKGAMLCYRNETPIPKITISGKHPTHAAKVEILGGGQQFVAYGDHPDTGRPYVWTLAGDFEPLLTPLARLPEVTPDRLREFAERAATRLAALGYSDVTISDPGDPARKAAREMKRREERVPVGREELVEILGCISPDCDRRTWIGHLGGIQTTNLRGMPADQIDNELLEIAQAWSRGDYHADIIPANWESDEDVEAAFWSLRAIFGSA